MKIIIFLILVFPMPIITHKNNFALEYPKKSNTNFQDRPFGHIAFLNID
jgi:hypothetical protein